MKVKSFVFLILALLLIISLPLLYACDSGSETPDLSSDDQSTEPDSTEALETSSETTEVETTEETEYGTIINEGNASHEHTLTQQIIAPTCITEGYTLNSCECGFQTKSDLIGLVDHTLAQKTVDPTCTEYGGILEYCTVCTYSEMIEYSIEPYEHAPKLTVLEATCEEPERTITECTRCDHIETVITAPALGHEYVAPEGIALLPSAKNPEISYVSVCRCGDEIKTELSYSDVFSGAYVDTTDVVAKGLDISMWQFAQNTKGEYIDLDWQAIKDSGIDYVILKIGSSNGKDPVFEMSYAGAKAAGLDVGCYFYSYATSVEGISAEADFLLTLLEGKQFEYPVYLDFEDPSQEALANDVRTEMIIEFLSKIQENGYYGALYAGQYWLHNYFDTARINSLFDVWMAKYKYGSQEWNSDTWDPTYTYVGTGAYGMWQFTSTATVLENGVTVESVGIASPSVDKNYCYKDYPTLIKSLGYNGFEKPADNDTESI
ncbi:MAG: hypothetical protein IKL59_01145 [Clostridia bacterium]|nr:hypothetical protein [Clostridia bacterium]